MDQTLEDHVVNLKKIFREAIQEALNSSRYGPYSHPEYSSIAGRLDDRMGQAVIQLEQIARHLQSIDDKLGGPTIIVTTTSGGTDASKTD